MQPAAMEAVEEGKSLDRVGASHRVQGREQLSADGRQMACWIRVGYGMVWYGMVMMCESECECEWQRFDKVLGKMGLK